MNEETADDVSAASACYLYNVLPSIMAESPPEAFRRLAAHFLTAIRAYHDARAGWGIPEPSTN